MKKKILIVITTEFVPFGGLTTVMMNYYRKINRQLFHIDFASTNSDVDCNLLRELEDNGSKYFCLGNRKKRPIAYAIRLYRLLKNNGYDIIHVNSNSATAFIELSIAKKQGVKKRIVHNHTSKCNHIRIHNLFHPFFKHSYTDAIACSNKAGSWIFTDDRYVVLNNGIDTEKYRFNAVSRKKIRDSYNIKDECVLIGHLGKIYEPKNHAFLINIFNSYHMLQPNSKLILIGDGELRYQIEKQVREYDIEDDVIFTGMQSNVSEFLSAIDIFVFPSIWEGMPLSVIEAQSSGLDCLLSDRIDPEVKVTEGVKFYSIDRGVDEWVNALNEIIIQDRKKMSNLYVESIKTNGFDVMSNVETLEDIYLGVTK